MHSAPVLVGGAGRTRTATRTLLLGSPRTDMAANGNASESPVRAAAAEHPPVSGGKRPLCTLGVPPGRSRGIGGCARAPCVFLAGAEGTA
eukprot:scaffold18671_cov54-Phaeocystis_antarctica.AAC.2